MELLKFTNRSAIFGSNSIVMKRLFLIFCVFLTTSHAIGWGQTGHRTIGLIAENHMSKKALKNIKKVMGSESVAMAGNWMD